MTLARHLIAASIAFAVVAFAPLASADMTKEQCLDAHSRGQDAKEQNKLSLARKLFLTCAQASCPPIVQGDCARFADELSRLQPSVTFIARDASGADLAETTVYVDGELVTTHLDGAQHDVDPGSHVVKFKNGGKERLITVVVGGGEKGRAVTATFAGTASSGAVAASAPPAPSHAGARTTHARGAKYVLLGGAVLAAGGVTLTAVGLFTMPSTCTLSTHQCAAPPGDPVFAKAHTAARYYDAGMALGIAGGAALAGGLVWYVVSGHTDKERMALTPWLGPSGGGFALSGAL
jgi:hypothetical protein